MVDTSKTRSQLISRALKSLGKLDPGEAPSPEDYETLDDLIDPLVAQLAADKIVYISDTDAIELEFYLPLARLLANAAGPDFGSPVNLDAKAVDEAELRKLNSTAPTYQHQKALYY